MLQRGNSGDGCDLASTLCKYDLRKGYLFVGLGKGATNEVGTYILLLLFAFRDMWKEWGDSKYLFRVANVCWRCAQYFIISSCG